MVPTTLLSPRDERSNVGLLPPPLTSGSSSHGRRGRGSTARTGFSWRSCRPAALGPLLLGRAGTAAAGVCGASGAAARSGSDDCDSARCASGFSSAAGADAGSDAAEGSGSAAGGTGVGRGGVVSGSRIAAAGAVDSGVASAVGSGVASGVGVGVGVAFGEGVGVAFGVEVAFGVGVGVRSAGAGDRRRMGAAASCPSIDVAVARLRQTAERRIVERFIVRGGKSRSPGS